MSRLVLLYAIVFIVEVVWYVANPTVPVRLFILIISSLPFLVIWTTRGTVYSFDNRGLYKRGKMLLDWTNVKSVEIIAHNKSFSHSFGFLAMPRTWITAAALLDPSNLQELVPTMTGVSYSLSLVFHSRGTIPGGQTSNKRQEVVHVPADFDKFVDQLALQKMKDAVSSRGLDVSFTFVDQGKK